MKKILPLSNLFALLIILFGKIIIRLRRPSNDINNKVVVELTDLKNAISQASENIVRILSIRDMNEKVLNELSNLNNTASQAANDISNTFYVYLVLATLISAGIGSLVYLYFSLRSSRQVSPVAVAIITCLVLAGGGILSYYFLQRIIQLSLNHNQYIARINKIVRDHRLRQQYREYINEVPAYIRRTIVLAASFCCGGVTFIIFALLIFRLLPSLFSIYSPFTSSTSLVYKFMLALLIHLNVILLYFANYQSILHFFKKKPEKVKKLVPSTLSSGWPLLFIFLIIAFGSFFLGFFLAPFGSILIHASVASPPSKASSPTFVITDRAYITAGLLGLLAFFICLLYLGQYYDKESKKLQQATNAPEKEIERLQRIINEAENHIARLENR